MQASIDNQLWRSVSTVATKSATGSLVIKGNTSNGQVTLNINSSALGTYLLGTTNQTNSISYSALFNTEQTLFGTTIYSAPVNKISISSGGSGYTAATSVVTTTNGAGTGLKVDIKINSTGSVNEVLVNAPGNGYKAGDFVTITGGNGAARIIIQNVTKSNGEIVITESANGFVSGNYKFVAVNTVSGNIVVARNGVFYKIPVK